MNSKQLAIFKEHLFSSVDEMKDAHLNLATQNRILRLRDMYTYMRNYPKLQDKDIILEIKRRTDISKSVAYEDLRIVKICLGAFEPLSKEWDIYNFRQRAEEGFEMARMQKDPTAFAKVLAAYGKYMKLDKDDEEGITYSDIVPTVMVPTDDPTVVGMKRIPNVRERAKALREKFSRKLELKETVFEEVKDESKTE